MPIFHYLRELQGIPCWIDRPDGVAEWRSGGVAVWQRSHHNFLRQLDEGFNEEGSV